MAVVALEFLSVLHLTWCPCSLLAEAEGEDARVQRQKKELAAMGFKSIQPNKKVDVIDEVSCSVFWFSAIIISTFSITCAAIYACSCDAVLVEELPLWNLSPRRCARRQER